MRAVFLGAGSLTVSTARVLLKRGHEVVVIERDKDVIETLSEEIDCGFIHDAYPEPPGCQMELGLPQSPSALARVNLNLAVTINAPGTELVTSAVTPAGSAQAPDGAVVNVSVGGPDGYSASCTATVAGGSAHEKP